LDFKENVDISVFLKKEGNDIFSQITIKFAFKYRNANISIKILRLQGKW